MNELKQQAKRQTELTVEVDVYDIFEKKLVK